MGDLVFVSLILMFFAAAVGFAIGLEKI